MTFFESLAATVHRACKTRIQKIYFRSLDEISLRSDTTCQKVRLEGKKY